MFTGPNIATDGLVLALDAANTKSYPGSGTTWYDLSGYGNNGTLTNSPTYTDENSGCIKNNIGDGSFINLGNNSSMAVTPTDLFTLEVVAKINTVDERAGSDTSVGTVFGRGSTGGSHGIGCNKSQSTGQLKLQMGTRAVNQDQVTQNINKDELFHVVLTYDTNNLEGFYNGVSLGTDYIGDDTGGAFDNENWGLLKGGAVPGGNSEPLSGSIYLARMYFRALSTKEVLQNYNAVKERFGL